MLTNSTCFPPRGDVCEGLGIPISSRTSANLAPPHTAAKNMHADMKWNKKKSHKICIYQHGLTISYGCNVPSNSFHLSSYAHGGSPIASTLRITQSLDQKIICRLKENGFPERENIVILYSWIETKSCFFTTYKVASQSIILREAWDWLARSHELIFPNWLLDSAEDRINHIDTISHT